MSTAARPRHRWLRSYDVHELSLVQFPDIGRACAALKDEDGSDDADLSAQQLGAIADLVRAKVNKSRVPQMDQNGQPIQQDPNALTDKAVRTMQALARLIAQHKDELTIADLQDLGNQMGLQSAVPGDPQMAANDPMAMDAVDDDGEYDPVYGDTDDDGSDVDDMDGVYPDDGDDDEDEFGNVPEATGADDDENAGDEEGQQAPHDAPPDEKAQDDAAPQAKPTGGGGMAAALAKPAGVHPDDHEQAAAGVKDAYLNNLSDKGYDLPKAKPDDSQDDASDDDADEGDDDADKKKPPFAKGKPPMSADKKPINKERPDLSNLPAEVREHFEMVNKSARMARQEQERLGEENKALIEKNADMVKRLEAIEKASARKEMITKTRAFSNLSDHETLADIALALPSDEAREKYMTVLKAQDAQMAQGNRFEERGTRFGNENPLAGDNADADAMSQIAQQLITKSREGGVAIKKAQAMNAAGMTDEGREAYNRMAREAMRQH